jgi:hypothetical protein
LRYRLVARAIDKDVLTLAMLLELSLYQVVGDNHRHSDKNKHTQGYETVNNGDAQYEFERYISDAEEHNQQSQRNLFAEDCAGELTNLSKCGVADYGVVRTKGLKPQTTGDDGTQQPNYREITK